MEVQPPSDLITAEELAEKLKISPRTVRVWTRAGLIPAVRISPKVVRYDYRFVCAHLASTYTSRDRTSRPRNEVNRPQTPSGG